MGLLLSQSDSNMGQTAHMVKKNWLSDLLSDQNIISDSTWTIFEVDQDITKTYIQVKFQEDWNKTVL